MSSITFPYSGPGHSPSPSSSSINESSHFPSSYSASADTDSFQMNPLSSHPPRTPRTSIISSSHVYTTEVYSSNGDAQERPNTYEEDTEDEDDTTARNPAQHRVRKEEIWRELLKTSNGRDKTFKLMQYSLRMYLLFHTTIMASPGLRHKGRRPWEAELMKRLQSAIAGFSLTRKCLILFNWLPPLTAILAEHSSVPFSTGSQKQKPKPLLHTFLHASPPVLLEFVNGLADDAYTFSRLGLVGTRAGEQAGRLADWCWFASTLVNLVENSVERNVILDLQHQVESRLYTESMTGATSKSNPAANKIDEKELARLQRQDYWIQITRIKLLMDLVYVSYNVFNVRRARGQVQTFTGLASAALSTAKLFDRHKTSLLKGVHS
ncbi:hypothetical protein A0H81_03552 [Grifola frondosa]|uniref:Uncharacterized protein n=1 Tax=Grifola frondosa TaxID=5627 RepID=A0A1C7MJ92_GRIFR|nr:hypothetical protein A0H81_03552 [Grifola frondosa]